VYDSTSLAQRWNDLETGANTLGFELGKLQAYVTLKQRRCESHQLLERSGGVSGLMFFRHSRASQAAHRAVVGSTLNVPAGDVSTMKPAIKARTVHDRLSRKPS
jgi:hypothetical protein